VVRVNRSSERELRSVLTLMRHLDGDEMVLRVRHVSGTAKQCLKAASVLLRRFYFGSHPNAERPGAAVATITAAAGLNAAHPPSLADQEWQRTLNQDLAEIRTALDGS
jgi:hypothetical protein